MCPDIESFAPLIEAAFGGRAPAEADSAATSGSERSASRRRFASGSPTARCAAPLRSWPSTARLLELASSRVTASAVLDLADAPPVRGRFGFDDEELTQIRDWVAGAHIHWGLDAAARAAYRLTEVDAGTWSAGLKRLLLGVAMDADVQAPFGSVLPAAAIQSSRSSSPAASPSSRPPRRRLRSLTVRTLSRLGNGAGVRGRHAHRYT